MGSFLVLAALDFEQQHRRDRGEANSRFHRRPSWEIETTIAQIGDGPNIPAASIFVGPVLMYANCILSSCFSLMIFCYLFGCIPFYVVITIQIATYLTVRVYAMSQTVSQ